MKARIAGGLVRGQSTSHGIEFLGIPYARGVRFGQPAAVEAWKGIRDCVASGPAAPQPDRFVARYAHGDPPESDEERCLNLNVFTPSLTGARPVLLWIHGGTFLTGHAGASLYHGGRLAQEADIVVVTVNYRLGSLGWLCHPSLAAAVTAAPAGEAAPTGNWGLLDLIAALRWVGASIASLGGDPERVTVAGQSAGALAAIDLLSSPQAEGMFRRLIVQSPPFQDLAQSGESGRRWAESLCALAGGDGAFDPQLLRALPAERIVAMHEELLEQAPYAGTRGGALPTIEPGTLPRSPVEDPGARPELDVLIGVTADEASFFFNSPWRPAPPPERLLALIGHLPGIEDAERTVALYKRRAAAIGRPYDPTSLLVAIATDAIVAEPAFRWADARAAAAAPAGGRVFRYRVDHPGAGPVMGATHTVDVPLLFGTWGDGGPGQRLGGQAPGAPAVGHELVTAWSRFVHGDAPGWDSIGAGGGTTDVGVFGGERPFRVEPAERGGPGEPTMKAKVARGF